MVGVGWCWLVWVGWLVVWVRLGLVGVGRVWLGLVGLVGLGRVWLGLVGVG